MVTHRQLSHRAMDSLSVMPCLALCRTRSCYKTESHSAWAGGGSLTLQVGCKGNGLEVSQGQEGLGVGPLQQGTSKASSLFKAGNDQIKSLPLSVSILPFISQPRGSLQNRVSKPQPLVRDDLSGCLCHTGIANTRPQFPVAWLWVHTESCLQGNRPLPVIGGWLWSSLQLCFYPGQGQNY